MFNGYVNFESRAISRLIKVPYMARRPITTHPVLYPALIGAITLVSNYALSILLVGRDYLATYIFTETFIPLVLAIPISYVAVRQRRRIFALNERLQDMVDHDALTQLKSRQYLLNTAADETKKNTVVMMIDVDHFKALNDAYGHQVGDRALQHMAQIFRDCCRSSDVISRYGGEEFVIVMNDSDLQGAALTAKRIRKRLAQSPVSTGSNDVMLTISVGISELRIGEDISDALVRADTAMYLAKEKGRDRVELAVVA